MLLVRAAHVRPFAKQRRYYSLKFSNKSDKSQLFHKYIAQPRSKRLQIETGIQVKIFRNILIQGGGNSI